MKGQNLRIGIVEGTGSSATTKYIAGALNFDLSVDCDVQDSSTKDSTGGFKENEPGLIGWSGSGSARLVEDATAFAGWDILDLVGKEVVVTFDQTEGTKNRELEVAKKTGKAIINSWKVSAQNGETVNVDFSFTGNGALEDAAA